MAWLMNGKRPLNLPVSHPKSCDRGRASCAISSHWLKSNAEFQNSQLTASFHTNSQGKRGSVPTPQKGDCEADAEKAKSGP